MKQLIIKNWIKSGRSLQALKLQKVVSIQGNRVELLNKKHGVLTYLTIGV